MEKNLPHTSWFKKSTSLCSQDGKEIMVYEFLHDTSDDVVLTSWASYFREHYCLDTMIDTYRSGTGKTREEYLIDLVFPDKREDFGPATRSGDFAEILVADLFEYHFWFFIPRTRYDNKMIRNESAKGADIIGFRLMGVKPSRKDVLLAIESKAQMSGRVIKERLQDATNHSNKDQLRLAESLNAMKRRLLDLSRIEDAKKVERFQDPITNPYIRQSGAAAVFCNSVYDPNHIAATTNWSGHENIDNLLFIVIHADDLIKLVHLLYHKAANGN